MPKFEILVTETLSRVVEVTAETHYEALNKVEDDYRKEIIVLDSDDYDGVDFTEVV